MSGWRISLLNDVWRLVKMINNHLKLHTCTHTYVHTHIRAHTHTHTHTHIHAHTHTHNTHNTHNTHAHTHTHTHTHTRTHTHMCTHTHTQHTLQDRMLPKALKVSYRALLSIALSRFLMKIWPTPEWRSEGSRWDHMIRHGRPLMRSWFMVLSARSADRRKRGMEEARGGGRERERDGEN